MDPIALSGGSKRSGEIEMGPQGTGALPLDFEVHSAEFRSPARGWSGRAGIPPGYGGLLNPGPVVSRSSTTGYRLRCLRHRFRRVDGPRLLVYPIPEGSKPVAGG